MLRQKDDPSVYGPDRFKEMFNDKRTYFFLNHSFAA